MDKTDLSSSLKPHVHSPVSLRKTLRCGFAVVLCSCLFYGAQQCRAQEAQQQNQDVAEAAREERTRREQEKAPPHVYTDEDLRRARMLTPEDEARLAAARKSQSPPDDQSSADSLDASGLPQLPLGDVARFYRSAKQATEPAFHLPTDEPVLASPVFPVDSPVTPRPAIVLTPAAPKIAPAHPKLIVPPSMSSDAPVRRVDPFTRRLGPSAPQPPVAAPRLSAPSVAPSANAASPTAPPINHVNPSPDRHIPPKAAESSSSAAMVAPRVVTVQRGDSLWKIAERTLGRGTRWRDLLAANPSVANPNVLEVGTQLNVPADIREPRATKVKVNPGDTLTKIAQAQYGHASYWRCIAQANSAVSNANRIYKGQELILPPRCKP